ncbi:MAG: hypothetical protein JJU36_03935 [Phycisphaeraceae bacterium]|nr:hypothetical protein [Phycisphaeraceae bacterium]
MADDPKKRATDDELLANAIPISDDDDDDLDEPIEVDLEGGDPDPNLAAKIRSFGEGRGRKELQWKRTPVQTGQGACHVKTFVAKLRLDAMDHLDEMINDWMDAHPEFEIKFVTTSVGDLKGKTTEPALVVNLWI